MLTLLGRRNHAKKMAAKRLPFVPNLARVARKVRAGHAQFVCWGHGDRPIYDVIYKGQKIRVVMNPELTVVITVLPESFRAEKRQRFAHKLGKTRRQIARSEEEGE